MNFQDLLVKCCSAVFSIDKQKNKNTKGTILNWSTSREAVSNQGIRSTELKSLEKNNKVRIIASITKQQTVKMYKAQT